MTGIIKLYRTDNQPFSQIPNDAIRDPRISSNAFRLLAYLMSHQDGYEITYEQIERQTGLGRKAINSARDQLIQLGWVLTERPKRNDGKFASVTWSLLTPASVPETTVREATVREATMVQRTDNKNNNLENNTIKKNTNKRDLFSLDWQPDENQLAKVKAEYPSADITKQVQLMIDYIVANGKEKQVKDMAARFRTWLANADSFSKGALSKDPNNGLKRF
jgi:predicted transcriptional regulator